MSECKSQGRENDAKCVLEIGAIQRILFLKIKKKTLEDENMLQNKPTKANKT